MQKNSMRTLVALAIVASAATALGQIKWMPSSQAALDHAKETNRLVMVEFYATWDKNSQNLDTATFGDKAAQGVANKFVPVRVNVDKEGKDLAGKFHVTNYPTVLFMDKSQKVDGIIDGFEDATEFIKHGNSFLQDYADEPAAEKKYKANPKNLDAVARLGAIYADRYQIAPALNKLAEAERLDPNNASGKLTDMYSNIGDYYQNASQYEPAVKYFKKEAETSKLTDKRAYGYLSIVACYFSMDVPSDPNQAPTPEEVKKIREHFKVLRDYVKTTLALPNLKKEDRDIADQDLNQIETLLQATGG